jgi:hypothetical protein
MIRGVIHNSGAGDNFIVCAKGNRIQQPAECGFIFSFLRNPL